MRFDPLDWIDDELATLDKAHLRRTPTMRGGAQRATTVVDSRRLINFGSNDYLGLAADPRLVQDVATHLPRVGWGSGASPLITGRSASQAELERHLASWEGAPAAIVFPSGFAANAGTLSSLAERGDLICSDAKNHASLIDGCRLSRAEVAIYPHQDLTALRDQLVAGQSYRRRLIVTDSLFSMDGDFARLPDLAELAERYQAILVVDEAHATGVWGERGRGVCELQGVEDAVPVRIGTLSKACGSIGGFVVGSQRLVDWLFNRARPFVFSTALPAACHIASLAALRIIRDEPWRRKLLRANGTYLRAALREQGWPTSESNSQIIPVRLADPERTMQATSFLREAGLLVPGIRPPTVPHGESMLRISLTALHSREQLDLLLAGLKAYRSSQGSLPESADRSASH